MKKQLFFGFKSPKVNRGLVMTESVITASILSIAVMTPFFNSIGMSQEEIAISQMACVAVLMATNIPMGWVTDRFSRKWANVVGDLLCGGVLLAYSRVTSLAGVIACEATFGLAAALSQGVDSSLLRHFAGKDDPSGRLFKRAFGRTQALAEVVEIALMLLAGPIAGVSLRLCIAVSGVPFFLGALIAACVGDDSPKLESEHANPFKGIVAILKRNFGNPRLRLRAFAFATGRELTHGIIWVFTPMLLLVGVPLEIVSMGWLLNNVTAFLGIRLAKRYASRLGYVRTYVLPFVTVALAGSIMFFRLNIVTVWLYSFFGLARGWSYATMLPTVKELVADKEQATVESAVRVIAQLLYIITIYVINRAADVELRYGLAATLLIFLPLATVVAWQLRRQERQE